MIIIKIIITALIIIVNRLTSRLSTLKNSKLKLVRKLLYAIVSLDTEYTVCMGMKILNFV